MGYPYLSYLIVIRCGNINSGHFWTCWGKSSARMGGTHFRSAGAIHWATATSEIYWWSTHGTLERTSLVKLAEHHVIELCYIWEIIDCWSYPTYSTIFIYQYSPLWGAHMDWHDERNPDLWIFGQRMAPWMHLWHIDLWSPWDSWCVSDVLFR